MRSIVQKFIELSPSSKTAIRTATSKEKPRFDLIQQSRKQIHQLARSNENPGDSLVVNHSGADASSAAHLRLGPLQKPQAGRKDTASSNAPPAYMATMEGPRRVLSKSPVVLVIPTKLQLINQGVTGQKGVVEVESGKLRKI